MDNDNDERLRSGVIKLKTYLTQKRSEFRLKARINPPENYARLSDKSDPRFNLTPDQLTWFYPASKDVPDWNYEGDYLGSGFEADVKYLDKLLPTFYPPRSYFEEEEIPFLMSLDSRLQYPPLYFIS
jgi:hypothetical protein